MTTTILLDGLTKFYGRERGVVDLSFEVRSGEIFGYLGPNGAGKTTTIRTLMDLIRPTRGRAEILGLDTRLDAVEVRRRVGYLPGELALYEAMSGEDLLRYFGALRGGAEWRFVRETADRIGADLTRRIGSLSHGNKQKVGLVQALMHRPEVLLLDEPTAGLDPLVQQEFHGILAEMKREGRTVFLSSHNLPEVERTCDRVGIIREGRLAAVEDVGDLQARAFREIELHFDAPVAAALFAGLPGVRDASALGDLIRLKVEGPVDAVIKAAAAHTVVNVTTREPSLEDIFLTFYGEEAPRAA